MNLTEQRCETKEWIQQALDRINWRGIANTAVKLQVL